MKQYRTLLFYKFAHVPNAEEYAHQHLLFARNLGVMGRVLFAEEGINGTISGTTAQCDRYMEHLSNDPIFAGIEFKIDEEDEITSHKLHVRYRPEIIHFGVPDINPCDLTGNYLEPDEVLAMKDQPDVVMLDTRNNMEHLVGKFKNAITLDLQTFRDFPEKVDELREELKDKRIITYCTGGIRCEKATAYMIKAGFDANKLFQIHGGIIKYAKETGGTDFDGYCYVFDKRVVTPINEVNPTIISKCHICNTPEIRMVNCSNPECNEHFVLCEKCGWEMEGACCTACKEHPRRRIYDGTGYYTRNGKQLFNAKQSKPQSA